MKNPFIVLVISMLLLTNYLEAQTTDDSGHTFNNYYEDEYLNHVAFPIGGIGAGMLCIEGSGAWSHFSIRNKPDVFNEPLCFAAIHVKGQENGTKLLQGPVPKRKVFGGPGTGNGKRERSFGLPRFDEARFLARFPFAEIELIDQDIPLDIKLTGWSPFTPGDEDNSSLPVGAVEYSFHNPGDVVIEAVFSWNTTQIIALNSNNEIQAFNNGIKHYQAGSEDQPENESWFAVWVDDPETTVDYCWFRGGWFDALTMAWKQIESGELIQDDPKGKNPPGASFFVPIRLEPGETRVIPLKFCWYVPQTNLTVGASAKPQGPAFSKSPSGGAASGQQEVTGFKGSGLINSYDPLGDGQTGVLTSKEFIIEKQLIRFLIGGGAQKGLTCVNLLINDEVIYSSTGNNDEHLDWEEWDVTEYAGQMARIQIVDKVTGAWGHINVDHLVMVNKAEGRKQKVEVVVFEDFEQGQEGWVLSDTPEDEEPCCEDGEECCEESPFYKPWYAGRFKSVDAVAKYWNIHYEDLRRTSALFRDAIYASTLPQEVMEAVTANLTILKSPTVLRQTDGKLWAWEGCSDNSGCCSGSCTHVWNYAQAICHLFPALERSLRETEFFISQDERGHQTFRSRLPISPVLHSYHAASDGQLGGIMKVHREWRISGDTNWLKAIYPSVKQSLDFCMSAWDPGQQGVLTEPHHNTYDIEFWGPDGMCSSFYLGALTAFLEMSKALNEPAQVYLDILKRGKKYMESELYDGEYYIQKIQWTGLAANDPTDLTEEQKKRMNDEELVRLLDEGPKYQYGTGCLSDGILGMWMATVCGLDEVLDTDQVTSHLKSIHKYNLKWDLSDHVNPQRPSFACSDDGGLLLCSWPKGGALSLPFVYSNEVWTGIEYQVASHLMFKGEIQRGLDIVQACRIRYDGRIRNPFNEYECGHWYARAMSSYGLIEGLTGIRFDAVDGTLYIQSRIGQDFVSFLSTETGFANVGLRNGEPFIDVKWGHIPVRKIVNL
jgi:uncharacterized protein (DUF608 family)